jgi:hypothetical protein
MLLVRLEYVILVSCPLGRRPPGVINIIIISSVSIDYVIYSIVPYRLGLRA